MPPQPLQIGPAWQNDVPSFMQQGQVDWVAFGNTIWSASAAVLQRFASSGIQPVTLGAGLALASRFRISEIGRERMDDTMRSLRGVPGWDKILWFGFGYQSFVRMMGESQLGLNCIALCSCLTEVHSEETAARVFQELWQLNEFPENYEPSYSQILALVKACSGVLARSGFSTALDAMTGHGLWKFGRERVTTSILKASNARDIATALNALFKITRNRVDTITLLGQNECAFIAAFAHWLFDLAIYVEDDAGDVLFKSRADLHREGAQVLVIYSQEDQHKAIRQSTTYILPVGTDVVSRYVSNSESRWILKIPWDGCLLRTFGSTFRALSGLAHILGSYLGGAARIYGALATAEINVGTFSRVDYIGFTQFSYGKGFIHSVVSIFKELDYIPLLYDTMERVSSCAFDHACKEVEQAAQSLINTCHCSVCSDTSSSDGAACGECLFALAMTFCSLVTVLACTDRDEALLVAVHGLQLTYAENHGIYSKWARQNDHQRTLVSIVLGLSCATDKSRPVLRSESLLAAIRPLFDGSRGEDSPSDHGKVATASSGICCYRDCLRELSCNASAVRIIHVVPGHIERDTAQYDIVGDARVEPSNLVEPVTLSQIDSSNPTCETVDLGSFEIKTLASESSIYRKLGFAYKVILPDGVVQWIGPGIFSSRVLQRTGMLTCYRSERCKKQLALSCFNVKKGWAINRSHQSLERNGRMALYFWSYHQDVARWVALSTVSNRLDCDDLFLRSDECLPCCSESILRESASILNGGDQVIAHVL